MSKTMKPLRKTVRPNFGGKRCTFTTFAEVQHPTQGLCRFESTKENTVTTYFIRWGVTADGVAKGGGQPYKKYSDAERAWRDVAAAAQQVAS